MQAASIVCILVVGLGLSLEATHLHLDAKLGPARHCTICLSPHAALAATAAHPVAPESARPEALVTAEEPGHTPFHCFSLYNRPPPPQA